MKIYFYAKLFEWANQHSDYVYVQLTYFEEQIRGTFILIR